MLDAFAVIAYLRDEPAAEIVAGMLAGGDVRVTATTISEVVDQLVRIDGYDDAGLALDLVELGLANVVPIDASVGVQAGLLRARHYHRASRAVSMADCLAAAAAREISEPLATADPALLDLCCDEGITVLALPASDGSTWRPPE